MNWPSNPGYGFRRFVDYLGIKPEFVFDLFEELREYSGGKEDPIRVLNDPTRVDWVTKKEYLRLVGGKIPKRYPNRVDAHGKSRAEQSSEMVPVPPINFSWGDFEQK